TGSCTLSSSDPLFIENHPMIEGYYGLSSIVIPLFSRCRFTRLPSLMPVTAVASTVGAEPRPNTPLLSQGYGGFGSQPVKLTTSKAFPLDSQLQTLLDGACRSRECHNRKLPAPHQVVVFVCGLAAARKVSTGRAGVGLIDNEQLTCPGRPCPTEQARCRLEH